MAHVQIYPSSYSLCIHALYAPTKFNQLLFLSNLFSSAVFVDVFRFASIRFVFRHIVNRRIGERVPKLASDDTRYLNQQFHLQTNRMQC